MKHVILSISLTLLAVLFTACAPVEDDIFTTARITVTTTDQMSITRVQAQVKLTNINTRLCLYSAGDSTPTLAPYDFGTDNSKWNFRK